MSKKDERRWTHFIAVGERNRKQRDVPTTRKEWEDVTESPDDRAFGYETQNWETFDDGRDEWTVFLPTDPDHIRDNEFIAVRDEALVDAVREI